MRSRTTFVMVAPVRPDAAVSSTRLAVPADRMQSSTVVRDVSRHAWSDGWDMGGLLHRHPIVMLRCSDNT